MIKELTLHRAKDIPGWMSDVELQFLAEQASKSKVIIEIGSFAGRSTRALADNIQFNGRVYAVDPWGIDNYNGNGKNIVFSSNENTYNMFYCHLSDKIQDRTVIPCRYKWSDYIPSESADFIFIDGDHRYESVKLDILKAMNWINRNGIISGHDYALGWPGVMKAVNELFPSSIINITGTIWSVQL